MIKIKRSQFISEITSCDTIFLGTTNDGIAPEAVLNALLVKYNDDIKNGVLFEHRKGKAHSTYIEFTGGSNLLLAQSGIHMYLKHENNGDEILISHNEQLGGSKTVYYLKVR